MSLSVYLCLASQFSIQSRALLSKMKINVIYYLQRNEAAELEKKLTKESAAEKLLAEEIKEFQKNVESLSAEVKRCRDLKYNVDKIIDTFNVRLYFLLYFYYSNIIIRILIGK